MDRQNMNTGNEDQDMEDGQGEGRGWHTNSPEDQQRHQAAGQKSEKTIKERHGANFYQNIGREGGKKSHSGGQQSQQGQDRRGGDEQGQEDKGDEETQ